MKWIGQHIWDFISRFRSTVYLEDLDTSSEQNVLVVDSDGKVTKNTSLGGDDLTIANASDNRVVTSTGSTGLEAESTLTYNPSVTQEYFQPFEPDYDNGLLTIGVANNSSWDMGPTITTADATSGNVAKGLRLRSGASSGTNKGGAPVTITSGIGTGSAQPNILDVEGPNIGSPGTTANEPVPALKLWKAVNGTYGKSTILQIFDPGCTDITLNNLSFYVSEDADHCVIQARKHNGAAKLTLDVDGDIDINADGGDINFKDGANQLAKINTNGLCFVDNTGAGIIFEGTTDDVYNTTLTAADTTGSSKTITLPNATGTVALTSQLTANDDVSVANLKTRLAGGFASNAVSIGDSDDTVTIPGNLTVSGTTTTINTTDLNVEDKNITLNYHATNDTSASADGAGITVQDAVNATTDATINWNATDDTWDFSHKAVLPDNTRIAGRLKLGSSSLHTTIGHTTQGSSKVIELPNIGGVAQVSDSVNTGYTQAGGDLFPQAGHYTQVINMDMATVYALNSTAVDIVPDAKVHGSQTMMLTDFWTYVTTPNYPTSGVANTSNWAFMLGKTSDAGNYNKTKGFEGLINRLGYNQPANRTCVYRGFFPNASSNYRNVEPGLGLKVWTSADPTGSASTGSESIMSIRLVVQYTIIPS